MLAPAATRGQPWLGQGQLEGGRDWLALPGNPYLLFLLTLTESPELAIPQGLITARGLALGAAHSAVGLCMGQLSVCFTFPSWEGGHFLNRFKDLFKI